MGKKDRHTIFNTIRQLQRLPRLLTDRERNILQLIPVIRDMFSCFSVCASALILTLLPNLIPISPLIPFPTHLHLYLQNHTARRKLTCSYSNTPPGSSPHNGNSATESCYVLPPLLHPASPSPTQFLYPVSPTNSSLSSQTFPSQNYSAPYSTLQLQDSGRMLGAHVVVREHWRKLQYDVDSFAFRGRGPSCRDSD
jgi:hypothetical protein